ncbi:MAG: tRNA preQ1(34) S-adenosylmethionine ribosyltransferase-isomerase QueA [Myxococcales bacterium]|nr:tRNA preQ1(34) S-adenosylmethionine ribosyltransferase-isomerase QueA [Myxococcales bacterium]
MLEMYDFELPREQIAQYPNDRRDQSRLMLLDEASGAIAHHRFSELPELLPSTALLVVNDTRVIPARLLGRKETGGAVELLLVEPLDGGRWLCMARASKALRAGARIDLPGSRSAQVLERRGEGEVILDFGREPLDSWLSAHGAIPLPPYIARPSEPSDRERYQTVFAREPGAVAAPTAGLHFTEPLLADLSSRGVERAAVTLHVGPGTFMPIRDTIENHVMHEERYAIPDETAWRVNRARQQGRPVFAVGTTVVRALESAFDGSEVRAGSGRTRLFIKPGYRFRAVDRLITNFHLPRSTLLLLVAALIGRERLRVAYEEAVRAGYRFFSYGDAMLIR